MTEVKDEFSNYINNLKNQNLVYICRAASMLCLGFGEKMLINIGGKQIDVCKYRVHIQCSWRVINPSHKILLAQNDIFEPKQNEEYTDDFDWDMKNNNLFDEKSKLWFDSLTNPYVIKVQIDYISDLIIEFSNGDILQTFIDASNDNECWRFFESNSTGIRERHLVVSGNKITLQ